MIHFRTACRVSGPARAVALAGIFGIAGLAGFAKPGHADEKIKLMTTLQAATQRVIERSMIDGAIQHLDLASGKVTPLFPTENHPMVVSIGENYVLCADLTDGKGATMPVDYYLAPRGERFALIRTEIDNRAPLMALMDAGKAAAVK